MRKRACAVCLENCLRLHGAEDEDDDEEDASPIGSSRAAKEEDNTVAQTPSFLKQMTEIAITSIMVRVSKFPISSSVLFVSTVWVCHHMTVGNGDSSVYESADLTWNKDCVNR